jgi:hypothetical protein
MECGGLLKAGVLEEPKYTIIRDGWWANKNKK